jgi:hypothetical protein
MLLNCPSNAGDAFGLKAAFAVARYNFKYVIFETESGNVVLEWGGVYFDINQNTG